MYSRDKIIRTFFLFLLPAFLISCATPDAKNKKVKNNPAVKAIQLYQKYISPVDGQRCRMYPSCSEYSRQAFVKHGLLTGWVMTCDRLMRCGRSELNVSGQIVKNGNRYCNDPLIENDWWWHTHIRTTLEN